MPGYNKDNETLKIKSKNKTQHNRNHFYKIYEHFHFLFIFSFKIITIFLSKFFQITHRLSPLIKTLVSTSNLLGL